MARRRQSKNDSPIEEILTLVASLPWWGGPLVAALAYVTLALILPSIFMANSGTSPVTSLPSSVFAQTSTRIAPLAAGVILLAGAIGNLSRWASGRKLDAQTGANSLGQLSWREFELLLAEAFRREGYIVEPGGGSAPDGGVDLRLFQQGRLLLVQCKHWKVRKVGVKVVRELRGVMSSEGADGGIVVTSGTFTEDAVDFARSSGIRLVDGKELLCTIRAVQRRPRESPVAATTTAAPMQNLTPATAPQVLAPACPKCGGAMIIRTAQKGPNSGNRFWGCSSYPRCRGIVNVAR